MDTESQPVYFEHVKYQKVTEMINDIKKRTLEYIENIYFDDNNLEKVREVFVRESKVVIIKKLNEFKSKLDLGLMSLTEIEDQLRKLYNCFRNLVSKAAHNINNKQLNHNGYSSDSNDKDEKDDNGEKDDDDDEEEGYDDHYESKKRKKIPHKAVAILKEWLMDNVQDPYPSNEVKEELAKKANLHVKQVHNWFINARGRIWKKLFVQEKFGTMVEKLYYNSLNKKEEESAQNIDNGNNKNNKIELNNGSISTNNTATSNNNGNQSFAQPQTSNQMKLMQNGDQQVSQFAQVQPSIPMIPGQYLGQSLVYMPNRQNLNQQPVIAQVPIQK